MPFLALWGTEFYRIPKVVKYVEDMIFSRRRLFSRLNEWEKAHLRLKFNHRRQTCIYMSLDCTM